MTDHLRHRWWLRLLVSAVAVLLTWSTWTVDPGVNTFLGLWLVAALAGVLGGVLPPWGEWNPRERVNRLPLAAQGLFAGSVLGAAVVLAVQGAAPLATLGLLIALSGFYADLGIAAWRHRPESKDDAEPVRT